MMESTGEKNDVPVQSTVATSEAEKSVENKEPESVANVTAGETIGIKVG